MSVFLDDILRRNRKLYPERMAVEHGSRRLSWRTLSDRARGLAASLRQLGVAHGARIALHMPNCLEFTEIYFAAPRIGAIVVPISVRLTVAEATHMVKDSGARVAIVHADYISKFEAIEKELDTFDAIIVSGSSGSSACLPSNGHAYESLVAARPLTDATDGRTPDDVVMLCYTSGTTGWPKGVMLSHRNIRTTITSACIERQLVVDDCYLQLTPLNHIGAVASMFSSSFMGGRQVIVDKFDAERFVDHVSMHGITHTLLMPTMVGMVVDAMKSRNALRVKSPLRLIFYGGEPISAERLREAVDLFDCKFLQGYGLTEASGLVTSLKWEDHWRDGRPVSDERLRSCGRETYHVETRIEGEASHDGSDGNDANRAKFGAGHVGELLVRSAGTMLGYWKQPEATALAVRDGWLHTGDLARRDEEGFLYIVDRAKDMIISGGENIYPREIERVLCEHPAVLEAAVIGVADPKWGESPKAFVVRRASPTWPHSNDSNDAKAATEESLMAFCRERLAGYKRPKAIAFLDALPRNSTGKLLKTELRSRS